MVTDTSTATPFATTLPGRYYHDPDIYRQEQERLFGRLWVCVGRADAIPQPGDYLTVDLAGESVLVVRGRDGVVCDWLFDPAVIAEPDFDPMDAVAFFDLVNRQDWEMCELCQQNMASRAYRAGGLYVPLEAHIRAFNDFVLECLEG